MRTGVAALPARNRISLPWDLPKLVLCLTWHKLLPAASSNHCSSAAGHAYTCVLHSDCLVSHYTSSSVAAAAAAPGCLPLVLGNQWGPAINGHTKSTALSHAALILHCSTLATGLYRTYHTPVASISQHTYILHVYLCARTLSYATGLWCLNTVIFR